MASIERDRKYFPPSQVNKTCREHKARNDDQTKFYVEYDLHDCKNKFKIK